MGPHPAVATCRRAVRELLKGLDTGSLVLVASSGGADSLALAAAMAFEGPRAGFRAGAVTVDHGLQPGSAERASAVAAELKRLGLDPVEIATVTVEPGGGPEAAARYARYRALDETAVRLGATAIFFGHTRDDQAETVLLGLARGSGARSLAGMAPVSDDGRYRRPFLAVSRDTTRARPIVSSRGRTRTIPTTRTPEFGSASRRFPRSSARPGPASRRRSPGRPHSCAPTPTLWTPGLSTC